LVDYSLLTSIYDDEICDIVMFNRSISMLVQ